jgi:transcriptional regulator with XRE-family HTH domain
VDVGQRLRFLREQKGLSQGAVEERTGLIRCYISRAENGHTVPALETLEKFTRALEMSLYQVLFDGEGPPKSGAIAGMKKHEWGSRGTEARLFRKLRDNLSRRNERERKSIMSVAQHVFKNSRRKGQ